MADTNYLNRDHLLQTIFRDISDWLDRIQLNPENQTDDVQLAGYLDIEVREPGDTHLRNGLRSVDRPTFVMSFRFVDDLELFASHIDELLPESIQFVESELNTPQVIICHSDESPVAINLTESHKVSKQKIANFIEDIACREALKPRFIALASACSSLFPVDPFGEVGFHFEYSRHLSEPGFQLVYFSGKHKSELWFPIADADQVDKVAASFMKWVGSGFKEARAASSMNVTPAGFGLGAGMSGFSQIAQTGPLRKLGL